MEPSRIAKCSVLYGGNVHGTRRSRSHRLTVGTTCPWSCRLVLKHCCTSTAVLTQAIILLRRATIRGWGATIEVARPEMVSAVNANVLCGHRVAVDLRMPVAISTTARLRSTAQMATASHAWHNAYPATRLCVVKSRYERVRHKSS